MTKTKTMNPDQIATELNIDAKAVRRHLRAIVDQDNAAIIERNKDKAEDKREPLIDKPGRGGSWAVGDKTIERIRERIAHRSAGRSVTLD